MWLNGRVCVGGIATESTGLPIFRALWQPPPPTRELANAINRWAGHPVNHSFNQSLCRSFKSTIVEAKKKVGFVYHLVRLAYRSSELGRHNVYGFLSLETISLSVATVHGRSPFPAITRTEGHFDHWRCIEILSLHYPCLICHKQPTFAKVSEIPIGRLVSYTNSSSVKTAF